MLKKLSKSCFFNLLSSYLLIFLSSALLLSCAPKVAPPPLYKDADLSTEDIIRIARGDINVLKAIAGINIEKNNREHSYIDASILLKKPNLLHTRLYKFGMMVGNYFMKDNAVYTISGKDGGKLEQFGRELFSSVFWWENLRNARLYKNENEYVIRADNKEIHLDKATLLPLSQEIISGYKKIHIVYDKPQKAFIDTTNEQLTHDIWYPSVVKIEIGEYKFTVKVEKLFINPSLGANDFKAPGERQ